MKLQSRIKTLEKRRAMGGYKNWREFCEELETGRIKKFTIHYPDGTVKTSDDILAEQERQAVNSPPVASQEGVTIDAILGIELDPGLKMEMAEFLVSAEPGEGSEETPSTNVYEEERRLKIQRLRELAKGCLIN